MNATANASAPLTGPKLDNRRVLAGLVDLAIVSLGAALVLFAGDSLSGDRSGALGAVIIGWALYYYFAVESGGGQTVGKKLMKLRVVRADGGPAGMSEIAVRTLLRVVDGLGLYIVGLIVMLVTGQRRQRLGDLAAGTIVVDASGTAPVAVPVVEADEAEEPELDEPSQAQADEPVADEPAVEEPVAMAPAPVVEFPRAEEPEEEPVEDAPVLELTPRADEPAEDEPVADEPVDAPVVELAPRVAEPVEDDVEDDVPDSSTPSLEQLAREVAAARAAEDEPSKVVEEDEDNGEDEPIKLRSVETVSAIDLVMGGAPEEPKGPSDDDEPASA